MTSPKIYLAGPIFGRADGGCIPWRREIASHLPEFEMLDPMRRDYRGREDACVREIVEGDKADIGQCSAVVALVETPSAGTSMEIFLAWLIGIPVIAISKRKPSPWVRYHSHSVVGSVADAVSRVREVLG